MFVPHGLQVFAVGAALQVHITTHFQDYLNLMTYSCFLEEEKNLQNFKYVPMSDMSTRTERLRS